MTKTYDAFTLKMVAIIGMLMQHTAIVLGPAVPTVLHFPLQFGGGFTFPIMAFLLVEGFRHTSNVKRYLGRIFIFALVSQVPHMMAFSTAVTQETGVFGLNIMFTLFVGLLLLVLHDTMKRRKLFWLLFVVLTLVTFFFDWGVVGPVMVLLYHIVSTEKIRRMIPQILGFWYFIAFGIIVGFSVGLIAAIDPELAAAMSDKLAAMTGDEMSMAQNLAGLLFPVGMLASIPLVRGYNGERGRSMKYLFYAFYPLHLLALALISFALGNGPLFPFI